MRRVPHPQDYLAHGTHYESLSEQRVVEHEQGRWKLWLCPLLPGALKHGDDRW